MLFYIKEKIDKLIINYMIRNKDIRNDEKYRKDYYE